MRSSKFLTVSDVVRRLDGKISAAGVRWAERQGALRAVRTAGGTRLFAEREVERWIRKRQREAAEVLSGA